MKVIIAGSRDFCHYTLLKSIMDECNKEYQFTEVVSGCARGADKLGEQWAEEVGLPIKEFPADWATYGKSAGSIRNRQMAEYTDTAYVFWDGKSRGSQDMVRQMSNAKKPCTLILDTSI